MQSIPKSTPSSYKSMSLTKQNKKLKVENTIKIFAFTCQQWDHIWALKIF
jgi:hypothetical protein